MVEESKMIRRWWLWLNQSEMETELLLISFETTMTPLRRNTNGRSIQLDLLGWGSTMMAARRSSLVPFRWMAQLEACF